MDLLTGLRRLLPREWYRPLPKDNQTAVLGGAAALLGILLFFVDHSLGYAVWLVAGLVLARRLPPQLCHALRGGIVALLVVSALIGWTPWSVVILLAALCAVFALPEKIRHYGVPAAALGAAVLYPFYGTKLFTIPVFGAWPDVGTAVVMLVFIMMAVGLNIVVGYAGLLDLGYVAFYATGAYTAAWFASGQFQGQKCPTPNVSVANCSQALIPKHNFSLGAVGVLPGTGGYHVSVWVLLFAGGVVTALSGIVIGLPTLRLRGDYLAIVTLGFGEILPQVARNSDNLFGTGFNLTNGPNGITPLDSMGFGHGLSSATGGFLPANYLQCCSGSFLGHQISTSDLYFWTGIGLLLFVIFCSFRLQYSRLGRAWIAIREDETAAAAMGIPLMRTKTWAYASGAFFGGVAGAFFAVFKSSTYPQDFFFNISVFILCMIILGGMGNISGVIVGAAFLSYLDRAGLANTGAWINAHVHVGGWRPNIDVPLYEALIFGVIIVAVMLLRPEGLLPSRRRAAELHEGVHDEPLYGAGAE